MPTPATDQELVDWRQHFGAHLRTIRQQHDLSQEALAERAGVDRQLIYRTELGQNSPSVDAIVKIAKCLGMQPASLLPKVPE